MCTRNRKNDKNDCIKQDIISLIDESAIPENSSLLLVKYIERGNLIRQLPSIASIQNYHSYQFKILPERFKVLDIIPDRFPVKYSKRLQSVSNDLKV